MKTSILFLLSIFTLPTIWLENFNDAQKAAKESHKNILINFSGSDWCAPCIRLRKEILESDTFEKYAANNLILVRADFPRQKKNQPTKEQIKLNEALADKYNQTGKFPFTVLVDENGKVIRSWDGFPDETATSFVAEIEASKK